MSQNQSDTLQHNNGKSQRSVPNPEVVARAARRRFTAEYKQRILQEVDACTQSGEIGALLRREGLFSSYLRNWRQQRDQGARQGLTPAKRGRKADPLAAELAQLKRENERLKAKLERAELIIDVQKKVSQMFNIPLAESDDSK